MLSFSRLYARQSGQYRPNAKTKIKSYVLKEEAKSNPFCVNIARPELNYSAKIFKKQYPDWNSFY